MRLVKDWHKALKWHSMQVMALLAFIPVIWDAVPPELRVLIPEQYHQWIITGVAVVGMILRLVKQGRDDD